MSDDLLQFTGKAEDAHLSVDLTAGTQHGGLTGPQSHSDEEESNSGNKRAGKE